MAVSASKVVDGQLVESKEEAELERTEVVHAASQQGDKVGNFQWADKQKGKSAPEEQSCLSLETLVNKVLIQYVRLKKLNRRKMTLFQDIKT